MANFLIVLGTPIPIATNGAKQLPSIKIGESARTASGRFVSTVSGFLRAYEFTTGPMTPFEEDAFRADVDADAEVTVAGDFFMGGTLTCIINITASDYISDGTVDGFLRIVTFTVEEVG